MVGALAARDIHHAPVRAACDTGAMKEVARHSLAFPSRRGGAAGSGLSPLDNREGSEKAVRFRLRNYRISPRRRGGQTGKPCPPCAAAAQARTASRAVMSPQAWPVSSHRRMMIGIGTPSSHRHPDRISVPFGLPPLTHSSRARCSCICARAAWNLAHPWVFSP